MAALAVSFIFSPLASQGGSAAVSERDSIDRAPTARTGANRDTGRAGKVATSRIGKRSTIGAETRPRSGAAVVSALRARIADRRQAAFRHADYLGRKRYRTEYRERRSRSVSYLRYLRAKWSGRAHRLWLHYVERRRTLVGEAELRAYINDDCLEEIVDRESAGTWSPTVRNYTDGIAYGLPQARPGWKMASAGSDWRTNPKTQIKWMRGYVNGRYGGSCGALAHHNAKGWY